MTSLLDILREQRFQDMDAVGVGWMKALGENHRNIVKAMGVYLNEHSALLSVDLEQALTVLLQEQPGAFYRKNAGSTKKTREMCIPRSKDTTLGSLDLSLAQDVKYEYIPLVLSQLFDGDTYGNIVICRRTPTSGLRETVKDIPPPTGMARLSTEWVYYKDEGKMKQYIKERIERTMRQRVFIEFLPEV